MSIDYSFVDGPRGGLTFDFIPCDHDFLGQFSYDRLNPAVFNIREEAFLFIEGLVARSFPDWSNAYRHWGTTWIGRDTWLDILARLDELRRDVRGNVPWSAIVGKYVLYAGLMPRKHKFHRKALLTFLDRFEERVWSVIQHHPYLLISGI
ncbi:MULTISPECIES: hypothetical protein [unclassified Rhizobium]|nr:MULTISPECIES: hypothetical protein [unclassified Rhizobium]